MSDLEYPVLAVESHAYGLVGLHELVELLRQVLILQLQHADMIV